MKRGWSLCTARSYQQIKLLYAQTLSTPVLPVWLCFVCLMFCLFPQTQCFITAMDALKLEQRAVDEVQPLIYDLSDRLNKVSKLCLPHAFG